VHDRGARHGAILSALDARGTPVAGFAGAHRRPYAPASSRSAAHGRLVQEGAGREGGRGGLRRGVQHGPGAPQPHARRGHVALPVCEVDPQRLQAAKDDFPDIETYGTLDELLKKSDVNLLVHITPHNLHFPLAMKCLKAGKHVITEKPFVITTAEADKLIAEAQKRKLMVTTYHNRHWDGHIVRMVNEVVNKGVIGEVFRVEAHMDAFGGYAMPRDWWRTSKSISGGVLYDWGVHLIEYMLQLLPGAEATEVAGFTKTGYWESQAPKKYPWKGDMNEDEAHAVVRFDNGAMMHLSISMLRSEPKPDWFLAAVGTKGSYTVGWKQWKTRIANRKHELVEKTGEHPKSDGGQIFYDNVAKALCGKEKLVITPQWARRPIHLLDLAGQSATKGKTLATKYG
jgi:scyllo-inositol 2-dehydrogenase (NADP+)